MRLLVAKNKNDYKEQFSQEIFPILTKFQDEYLLDDTIFYELEEFRELLVSWRYNEQKETPKEDTRNRDYSIENQLELPSINNSEGETTP